MTFPRVDCPQRFLTVTEATVASTSAFLVTGNVLKHSREGNTQGLSFPDREGWGLHWKQRPQ